MTSFGRSFLVSLVCVACLGPTTAWADESHRIDGTIRYRGEVQLVEGQPREKLRFRIEIDELLFKLNSLEKYKVVRVTADNSGSKTAVDFSQADDRFSLAVDGNQTVPGILNLSKVNPDYWNNNLNEEMRKRLAYPLSVEKDSVIFFYVLFPADKVTSNPISFTYYIKSLDKTVEIKIPPAVRKEIHH